MVAYCVCSLYVCVHRRLSSVLQSGLNKEKERGSWEVLGTQSKRT